MEGEAGTSSTLMAAHVCEPFASAEPAIGTSLPEASVPPTPLAPLRLTKNDDEPTSFTLVGSSADSRGLTECRNEAVGRRLQCTVRRCARGRTPA
jgi:hypothetical protein